MCMGMSEDKTDAVLIRDYLSGKEKSFHTLYRRYERPLFSYIFRFAGERQRAEDLFQQTWMKVLNGLQNYREQQKFSSWLFGIAHNCCIDEVRKASGKKEDDCPGEDRKSMKSGERTPEELLHHTERKDLLKKAIQELPEEQRSVVLMRLEEEIPFKEIAEIMNCSLNTVLGRMHYAVRNLRKIFQDTFGEEIQHVLS